MPFAPVIHRAATHTAVPHVHGCGVFEGQFLTQGCRPDIPANMTPRQIGMALKGAVTIYTANAIIPDPLGAGLVYIWERGEDWAISSDIGALLGWLGERGATPDKSLTYLAMLLAYENGAYNLSSFEGIRVLPPHQYITIENGTFRQNDYPVVDYVLNRVPYEQAVDEAAQDILANVRATRSLSKRIVHITGGFDSRLVFSAFLREGIPFAGFCTGRVGIPDFDIATRICGHFQVPMVRRQPFGLRSVPKTMEDALRAEIDKTHGMKVMAIRDYSDPEVAVFGGGFGECYRLVYTGTTARGLDTLAKGIAEDLLRLDEQYMKDAPGDDNEKGEFHYLHNRARYHFGIHSRYLSELSPQFAPLYSLAGIRAAFVAGKERRQTRQVLFDLMNRFNSALTRLPFGNGAWDPSLNVVPLRFNGQQPVFVGQTEPAMPRWENYPSASPKHVETAAKLKANLWTVINFSEAQALCRRLLKSGSRAQELFDRDTLERLLNRPPRKARDYRITYTVATAALWLSDPHVSASSGPRKA